MLPDIKLLKLLAGVAMLVLAAMIMISFTSCAKPPVIQEGELYPCFAARDCDFRNPKNPEKCNAQWMECRARERYTFCGKPENRWPSKDEQSCWDKLNSK